MSRLLDCDCCHLGFPEDVIMPFLDDKEDHSTLCAVCALQKVRKILGDSRYMFTTVWNLKRLEECIAHMSLHYKDVKIPKSMLLDT